MFEQYIERGWTLVPIQPGTKGPRTKGWNERARCITTADDARKLESAGLAHAYSGTCALDVDDWEGTEAFFAKRGVRLRDLFDAPGAVQIVSGAANRGKLLYRLPPDLDPLPSLRLEGGCFELRCATRDGKTVQDVLPPSKHPNGNVYEWRGDFNNLPELPTVLRELWLERINPTSEIKPKTETEVSADLKELRELVFKRDADCDYHTWVEIGMICHKEGGDEAFNIWDEWSAQGSKYKGTADLEQHWRSFGRGSGGNEIGIGTLRQADVADASEFTDLTKLVQAEPDDPWAAQSAARTEELAGRFRYLSRSEYIGLPKPTWIIDGVVPRAEVGSIYGQPGTGKTFVALDLCLAVARGEPWRDREVERGGFLYIAAEDSAGVRARLNAYYQQNGLTDDDAPHKIMCDAPNVLNAEERAAVLAVTKAAAEEVDAAIIVIDTLASVTPGADENAATDMSQLVDFCKAVHRDTGALVILVHHEGKTANKGPRGWSGLHGAFEMELYIADEGGERTITIDKLKNAPSGQIMPFRLLQIPANAFDDDGTTSCVIEHLEERKRSDDGPRAKAQGNNQKKLLEVAREQIGLAGATTQDELLDGTVDCVTRVTDARGADRTRENLRRALDALLDKHLLFLRDGQIMLDEEPIE